MNQAAIDALADAIYRAVDRYVDARMKALPVPKDGAPGKDGTPGEAGKEGAAGRDGIHGKDGAPGKDGERGADGIGHDGQDGQAGRDGRDGKHGDPGRDGEDGVGFDDLAAVLGDDGHTVVLRFTRGDVVKEFSLPFPVPRYAGTWTAGKSAGASAGECYTWGGSLWIALRDTKAAPGGASKDWQLAVKRGADAVAREPV